MRLASWDWDVALLQEVPPWWPAALARSAGAHERTVRTSRNALLPVRRFVAERAPDLIKSNGGGANTILARREIVEHRRLELRLRPERRVGQLARLADGTCVANHHGSARVPLAEDELARLWAAALAFAGPAPLVVGGDLNLRDPPAPAPDVVHVAARDVDHVFARGLRPRGEARRPARGVDGTDAPPLLSDHPPLIVELAPIAR